MALAPLATAEGVRTPSLKIGASAQGGFARISFDWPSAVAGRGQIADGVLVIRFDQRFDADTDALAKALEPYVALVRQDADGRTLRFALKGPVRLKSATQGARVSFDLVPPSFAGEPPPPAVMEAPKQERRLVVRVSERERVTRLMFDFPGKVEHSARLTDGKLQITFSKDAKVDLRRFADSPPGRVRGARSEVVDGKLRLEFDVDREAEFRDASAGDAIAFDLSDPKSDSAEAEATGAPKILIGDESEDAAPPPTLVTERITFALPRFRIRTPPRRRTSPSRAHGLRLLGIPMKLCIKFLQQALFHLALLGVDVNEQPRLLACWQAHKGHHWDQTLSCHRMICVGKQSVLAVDNPRCVIRWSYPEPPKRCRPIIALLLRAFKCKGPAVGYVDDDVRRKNAVVFNILPYRFKPPLL